MPVLGETIRDCLHYDFKVGFFEAAPCRRIEQDYGDDAVSERSAQTLYPKVEVGRSVTL